MLSRNLKKPLRFSLACIRPKTQVNLIEQLEIIQAWGGNPEEILSKDALLRGNITEAGSDAKPSMFKL